MHVIDHLTLEALQALAKKQPNAKLFQRYQTIALALQGRTGPDIASALGCTPRAVQKCVTRYNQNGPEALQEETRSGRPPRLIGPDLERFRKRVEAGPRPDGNRATFHGRDHQRIRRDEFGVKSSLQAV